MTIERVKKACNIRGIYFNGKRCWQNSMIGIGYSCDLPTGGFLQADTIDGLYNLVMQYPKRERK